MNKKYPIAQIIISVSIILSVFSYIYYDLFIYSPKINNEIIVVNEKFDDLKIFLDKKLPAIDSALNVKQEQLNQLYKIETE